MIRILVSNDDGIAADGLKALVDALSQLAEVYLVAPATQMSAMGQGMTLREPVKGYETKFAGTERAFIVEGTPTDCIKFGIQHLKNDEWDFDYVITGINMGANAGLDVHYSGTVAAAMEGAMTGYHSIALSVASHEATNFDYICDMLPELMAKSKEESTGIVLNVNAPDIPKWEVKGVRLTGMGPRSFCDRFSEVDGEDLYEYSGKPYDFKETKEDFDLSLIQKDYATITPLLMDFVDYKTLRRMKGEAKADTICMFIDYQEKLVPAMNKSKRLMKNTIKFARCVKALGIPSLITQQYTRGIGPTVVELDKELNPVSRIEKTEFNCLDTPEFEEKIDSWIGKTVVLAGIEAHICIQQTAMGFKEKGYEVVVIKDCCSSRKEEDFQAAMNYLAARGCEVTTYESFIYGLLKTSRHEAFKAISAIVTDRD